MDIIDIKSQLIAKYVPLDKSWIIRMGILDLLYGYNDIDEFLDWRRSELPDDLVALNRAIKSLKAGDYEIDVGESATLYRFLRFLTWRQDIDKRFILRGSLLKRKICENPEIVHYSQKDLLRLDNGTSQWASAAVLLGDGERISNPPFKLKVTYAAVKHWTERRIAYSYWEPLYNETIFNQAVSFLELLKEGKTSFVP